MCPPKVPKIAQQKTFIPQAPSQPEEPPKPVEIGKGPETRAKRRQNPLRIDLAAGRGGASGVNV